MISKVRYSTYSLIVTLLATAILLVGISILLWHEEDIGYLVAVILLFMLISGLIYGPMYVSVDKDNITVKSVMRQQRIPLSEINSVELFQPTMGTHRLFGSGGYMGYWGLFSEGDIGKYVAYYGKASDCFLVRLKNGKKYVLGCENPAEMVDYINSRI